MLDALGEQVLLRELELDSSRYLDELAAELTIQLGKRITIAHVLVGLQVRRGVSFEIECAFRFRHVLMYYNHYGDIHFSRCFCLHSEPIRSVSK